MVVTLGPELEAALVDHAQRQGIAPEAFAVSVLRDHLLGSSSTLVPRDAWERLLLSAASDCGIAIPQAAVSSEGLYE